MRAKEEAATACNAVRMSGATDCIEIGAADEVLAWGAERKGWTWCGGLGEERRER